MSIRPGQTADHPPTPPQDSPARPGPHGWRPDPRTPGWARPSAAWAARPDEATEVLPRRYPGSAAPPHPPTAPPPAIVGWRPAPAYPPMAGPRGARLSPGARVAAAAAAAVFVVGAGVLMATTGRSGTAAPSVASPRPSVSSTVRTPTAQTPPPTVSLSALPGLLLDVGTINGIEGATDIALEPDPDNSRTFIGVENDRPDCGGIQAPALDPVLQGSGWIGVRTQLLADPNRNQHLITNAVIDYPTAKAANDFAAKEAQAWAMCSGATLHSTSRHEPPSIWSVGTVTNRGGMLSVINIEEGAQGWACQRALTVHNNIVIDTRSCGENRADQATTTAARMAERVATS